MKILIEINDFIKKFYKIPYYRIALIYLIISILWIIYSDQLASQLFKEFEVFHYIQSIKGLFFVFISAFLIFYLIRRDYRIIKLQNQQIQKSQRNLQLAFDSADLGMYQFDFENQKVYLDNRSKMIFEMPLNAVHVSEMLKKIHPSDLEKIKNILGKLENVTSDYKLSTMYRIILQNGETKWIDSNINISFNNAEKTKEHLWGTGTIADITNKKLFDEQLTILQATIEKASIGAYRVSENGTFIYINEYACTNLGYTKEEALNLTIFDVDKDFTFETFQEHRKNVRANKYNVIQRVHTRKDGSTFPVEVTVNYLKYEDKLLTFSFVQDISERIQAEEIIKKEKSIFEIFIKHAPAAIAMFDKEMRYLSASRRFCRDFEIPEENLIGKSHYDLFPELPERWKKIHQKCLSGNSESCEKDPFLRANGRLDWIKWEVHPWYDISGEIGGIIIFSELITQKIEAEQALNESKKRFELAIQATKDGLFD